MAVSEGVTAQRASQGGGSRAPRSSFRWIGRRRQDRRQTVFARTVLLIVKLAAGSLVRRVRHVANAAASVAAVRVNRYNRAVSETNGHWSALEQSLRSRFELTSGPVSWAGHTLDILRPKSVDDLICEDDFNRDGRLPYWADVWPSALGLADRVARERGGGRRLLELGCAVGFVACLAARIGFQVTATDYYAEACDFTRLNAHRNGLPIPETRLVDWREYPADLRGFDVVIASDVLYEKPYCDLVAACFAQSLAADGLGILSDPQRTLAASFPAAAERAGLSVSQKIGVPVEKDGRHQVIDVYGLRRER
jgi:predicted nicotinamide N-methyase